MDSDRHGRAGRADNDRRRRPSDGFRAHDARRFGALVEDALADLPARLHEAVAEAEVEVEDVPPRAALRPAAIVPDPDAVPLARFSPPTRGRTGGQARLTVYRRPLEARATTRADLVDVVRLAVGVEVARALGLDEDLDDLWDDGPDD